MTNTSLESAQKVIRNWVSREARAKEKGLSLPEGSYPEFIRRVLIAREIQAHNLDTILSPKLSDLADPMNINGMKEATDKLYQAFIHRQRICIYADFDLDGTSGLALLYEGLRGLGFDNICYYQPKRLSEGYGFHSHAVMELKKDQVDLIVTVDVGITAVEAVRRAKENGIDVIITDHHQPGEVLPDTLILNPNLTSDKSGLFYLCGAGVAFYLLRAIKRKMIVEGKITESQFDLKSVLDFFTIGTLTDLVPLVEDNRALVKHGLHLLSQTQRPGFKALMRRLNMNGKKLTSQDVAIRFAPKLNALSRMEKGILPIDLMLVADAKQAESLVEQVMNNNDDRVHLQSKGEKEALDCFTSWNFKNFFFSSSVNFHRGVVGLIATKIAQSKSVPTFIGAEGEDGAIVGSARASGSGESVLAALEYAQRALTRFGGHHMACGFELQNHNKESFLNLLNEYYSQATTKTFSETIEFDFAIQSTDVSDHVMKWLDAVGPYGQSFPVPQFLLSNMKIVKINQLKGGHLKFNLLEQVSGRNIDAVYFSPKGSLNLLKEGCLINIIVELQWNYFNGAKSVQYLIKELEECRMDLNL